LFTSCLFAPALPLAPEADPERESDQAHIEPKGLFADIEKIIAKLSVWGGKEK